MGDGSNATAAAIEYRPITEIEDNRALISSSTTN